MKYVLIAMWLFLSSAMAIAEEARIDPIYLEQSQFSISRLLPCWDGSTPTVFGWYGSEEDAKLGSLYQTVLEPKNVDIRKQNYLFDLDPAVMTLNNMPLNVVVIDYKRVSGRCSFGFSPSMLVK